MISDNVDDYMKYCDGYRDGYNATAEGTKLTSGRKLYISGKIKHDMV